MKRWIHASNELLDLGFDKIVSLVLTDDFNSYNPRDSRVYAAKQLDYSTLTREQLLQLPKRELESIHDVNILRKLNRSELSIQQQIEVSKSNQENFIVPIKKVKEVLQMLKDCSSVHIWDTEKNQTFFDEIWNMGGKVTDEDARNIASSLHVSDYCYSTYSYLDVNWNNLLMVFSYDRSYTFKSRNDSHNSVTIQAMDLYLKIDIDRETRLGYAVMSFHKPEFNLKHPYNNYPIDKE